MKGFKTISSDDPVLQRVQDNISTVVSQIVDKAVLDGVLLKDVYLTTGSVHVISHKLGREPLGYICVKKNANSTIWESAITSRTLSLNCSANVTVSLWVF